MFFVTILYKEFFSLSLSLSDVKNNAYILWCKKDSHPTLGVLRGQRAMECYHDYPLKEAIQVYKDKFQWNNECTAKMCTGRNRTRVIKFIYWSYCNPLHPTQKGWKIKHTYTHKQLLKLPGFFWNIFWNLSVCKPLHIKKCKNNKNV